MSTREVMDIGGSRRDSAPKVDCVLENRMKLGKVKGGIKAFNPTQDNFHGNIETTCNNSISTSSVNNVEVQVDKKGSNMRPKQSPVGKRKPPKSEHSGVSPVQMTRQRSDLCKNLDEQGKELSVSSQGIEKGPVQIKKTRSMPSSQKGNGDQGKLRKVKSDSTEALSDSTSEGNLELRKAKSEPSKNLDQPSDGNVKSSLSLQLVKAKTVAPRGVTEEHTSNPDDQEAVPESNKDLEKSPVGITRSKSDENCKELGVCEDEAITSNVCKEDGPIKTPSDDDDHYVGSEEEEEDEEVDKEIDVEAEGKSLDMDASVQERKPEKLVVDEKELVFNNKKPVPISRKPTPPATNHARIHPNPAKTKPDQFYETPTTQSKLQSFFDLIMWRDVSKSALVFGIGAFAIVSSSYTRDLNISFISVLSYLGLVYLAAIFLFKSLVCREAMEVDDTNQDYVVGEEEAIWLIKLALPFVNEFVLKLRALFSGDPTTTIKMAVVLFIFARCGGSITIWKMAKLGFFGVFTVPKVYSAYSTQLTSYGTIWVRHFRDAWESCSHKKAVGFGIFTLVWNSSSVVARIWTVFLLFVAFKCYQQTLIEDMGEVQGDATAENSNSQHMGGQG